MVRLKQSIRALLYSDRGKKIVDRMECAIPFLREWHRFTYEQHFQATRPWERLFSGVYHDFSTARAHIPAGRKIGYDNEEAATFLGRETTILPSDYPILFWLSSLLQSGTAVFDFGGYLGLSYNSYKRYRIYPAQLTWTVYDVPAVVSAGEALSRTHPDTSLCYTNDFNEAAGAHILLAAGSLQYCEDSLATMLGKLKQVPPHLLINKLPTSEGAPFVTLQNMGPAMSPYHIFNKRQFVDSLLGLGYDLVDAWSNPDFGCFIPFQREHEVTFSGFHFTLRDR